MRPEEDAQEGRSGTGLIPTSDAEKLQRELDEAFPKAKSRSVVTHKGKRYKVLYFPLGKSRSGRTVTDWGHERKELTAGDDASATA